MASTKISGMSAATTPLDGTELVPIVQGGANKKTTVDDFLTRAGDIGLESTGGDVNLNADGAVNTNAIIVSPGYRLNGATTGGVIFADASDNLVQGGIS